jgi:hypothetical protein
MADSMLTIKKIRTTDAASYGIQGPLTAKIIHVHCHQQTKLHRHEPAGCMHGVNLEMVSVSNRD